MSIMPFLHCGHEPLIQLKECPLLFDRAAHLLSLIAAADPHFLVCFEPTLWRSPQFLTRVTDRDKHRAEPAGNHCAREANVRRS